MSNQNEKGGHKICIFRSSTLQNYKKCFLTLRPKPTIIHIQEYNLFINYILSHSNSDPPDCVIIPANVKLIKITKKHIPDCSIFIFDNTATPLLMKQCIQFGALECFHFLNDEKIKKIFSYLTSSDHEELIPSDNDVKEVCDDHILIVNIFPKMKTITKIIKEYTSNIHIHVSTFKYEITELLHLYPIQLVISPTLSLLPSVNIPQLPIILVSSNKLLGLKCNKLNIININKTPTSKEECLDILKYMNNKKEPKPPIAIYENEEKFKNRFCRQLHVNSKPLKEPDIKIIKEPEIKSIKEPEIKDRISIKSNLTLDEFDILHILGKGAYGEVSLVENNMTGNKFAMKKILLKNIKHQKTLKLINEENKILQRFNHPFIVNLFASFVEKQAVYFILQYAPNGDLFNTLVHVGVMNETNARICAGEIALGISELHKHNIIYRDLKPENILINDDYHILLSDFGLAKQMGSQKFTRSLCGTPEYFAPELMTETEYTYSIDWWCFGCIMYEMLIQQIDNREAMKFQICISELSQECRDLLFGLIQIQNKRLNEIQIKQHAFFNEIDWDMLLKKEYPPPFSKECINNRDSSRSSLSGKSLNSNTSTIKLDDFTFDPFNNISCFENKPNICNEQ